MTSTAEAADRQAQAKPVDASLHWDSFVILLEKLENASTSPEISPSLVKKLKSNHAWFLDSLTRFKPPNPTSSAALDSPRISFGQTSLRLKPEIREAALHVSSFLFLDEVQSYILVNRSVQQGNPFSDYKQSEFLHSISIHYYLERQCLLKCVRWIFMHALFSRSISHESDDVRDEALLLVLDGLENKLFSVLKNLLYPENLDKNEIDLMALWVEEMVIESNLVLDILFLAYYENFCICDGQQWQNLCGLLKGIVSGSFNIGKLAASSEGKKSFYHVKVQLLLILIETLNLENLLRMVHDDIPFRDDSTFLLKDIQAMDGLVASLIPLEAVEVGPLFLAWAVFIYLLLSLPDRLDYHVLMEIDHMGYVQNTIACAPFGYLIGVLHSDFFVDSDGPVSGYLSVLKTFISSFIASFDVGHQSEMLKMITNILCKIYRGEESLCVQFWDRNCFVDQPIRSLLYSLENDFPTNITELLRLLSALCEGSWPAECAFNFLRSLDCITSLYDNRDNSYALASNEIVVAPHQLYAEGFNTISIPSGAQGRILKVFDDNTALVQWKCAYSGVFVLLLRLAEFHSNSYEDIYLTLDLLYRMISFNKRLCFTLVEIDQWSIPQSAQPKENMQRNGIAIVKVVCSLVIKLVCGGGSSELVSLCINILVEMLQCLPSHVVEVTLSANIFGISYNNSSSLWLLSGGFAKMVLSDCEKNMESYLLTMSVLDFTIQLLEIGADNDMISSLVVFSLHYVLVNHENWSYKFRYARCRVTQKVFEVMKSCIKAVEHSSKLSSLIREIMLCDSSIHNVLLRAFCINALKLEGFYVSRICDLREIEGLQFSVCTALNVTFAMLKDQSKDTISGVPIFIQSVLSSTSKQIPVITATASLISFSQNTALQVAAARVLSMLCLISARVQPYSSENAFSVLDDFQLKDLSSSINEILMDEDMKNEELLISVINLLISAAHFQPAFLSSMMLPMDNLESLSNNGKDMKHQVVIRSAVASSDPTANPLNSIMQYVNKSKSLFERSPRLLLCILSLIKAFWNGNIQYMQILQILRSSDFFWKNMSSPIKDREDTCSSPSKSLDDDQISCLAYRCQCEAAIMEIIAHDIFLHKKGLHGEMTEKQSTEPRNEPKDPDGAQMTKVGTSHSYDILINWCQSSTLVSRIKAYSSSRYPEEIIYRAKVEVILCVVHIITKLSTGDAGSLSLSVVQKLRTVTEKLRNQPAFSALLRQYSVRGYSEGNEASLLVFTDLYYHILGELEGRVIAAGHFREVFQYLLELDIFQNYKCKGDSDLWPPENDINMFDVARLRTDLGIQLWDHSDWKRSKSVAERMISVMHHTNSVKFLAISNNAALRALTCLLSIRIRNLDETQAIPFGARISEPLLQSSVEHLCQCLQTAKASLLPAMIPSDDSLKLLATQLELLLNLLNLLLISYRHNTNELQLFPLSLLVTRTSGIALRFFSDVKQSLVSQRVVKFLLTLLLTSMEIIYPISVDNLASEVEQYAEASLLSLSLLPVLCKYTETSEHSNLSVAAIDFILKGFSTPSTWLPVLQNHLHLQLVILKVQQQCRLCSIPVIFKFLLTLAHTKGGAEILSRANIFQSLKMLLTLFLKSEPYSSDTEGFSICNTGNEDEDFKHNWGLGLAISASMICSLGDDITCTELVGNVIRYFYSEKASLMLYHLSFPKLPSDDHSKKKSRVRGSQTSLTALKETEYALMLTCMLAKHQNVWIKEMKEMDIELRETIIHMLAIISKGTQRVGDAPSQTPPLLCPPLLKKEIASQRRPAFVESKHGWFTLAALGCAPQNKLSALSSTYLSEGTDKQANGNANFQRTHFSDVVATQIYRIAFLLLRFLCTQARVASKRAEEVEYVDLAHFPELPMPEILHGIEDQSIAIVTEICQVNRAREIHPESESLCMLLLQILEKSLYLELCVSQSCGIRPVSGRVEDFSKEIKTLVEAVDKYPPLKASVKSLQRIIALVHPGLLPTSCIL